MNRAVLRVSVRWDLELAVYLANSEKLPLKDVSFASLRFRFIRKKGISAFDAEFKKIYFLILI